MNFLPETIETFVEITLSHRGTHDRDQDRELAALKRCRVESAAIADRASGSKVTLLYPEGRPARNTHIRAVPDVPLREGSSEPREGPHEPSFQNLWVASGIQRPGRVANGRFDRRTSG